MKKWLFGFLCVICMTVCFATGASAANIVPYTVTGGNIYFDADTGAITGCDGSVTVADIPSAINGVSVTSIEDSSFHLLDNLTSVTIPDSVTSIGNWAFYSCLNLTNVAVLNGVASIGACAFHSCGSLTSITIPDSVTSIGDGAFVGCYSLTSVTIPNGVTSIKGNMFADCHALTSVAIPDSVTSIESGAFQYCISLENVKIPDGVTSIGLDTFRLCINLKSIVFPNSITSIGYRAFYDCRGLTNLIIPNGVTSIGEFAFAGCSNLASVIIPDSVTSIESGAFYACSNLTDVYYTGTEEQWNTISGHNNVPSNSLHYESNGSNAPASTPKRTTVPFNQYCIHVVDKNGKPLKGATVYWEDSAKVLTDDTDANGEVYFPTLTLGVPKIDVSLSGYISWTNRNSNWSKSDKRYSEVILYDEAHGTYKLASAYYSNVGNETSWYNLLTTTKKLNLKNDGNLVGDLDFGNFYLTCTACTTQGIDRYELWQNSKQISQCADGKFPRLSVTSFSKGGGCFVRVIAKTGEEVDTAINLQFAENKVKQDTSVKFGKNGISITIADDDIPYFGGSTININTLVSLPANITVTEDKIRFELNTKPKKDPKEAQKQFDIVSANKS